MDQYYKQFYFVRITHKTLDDRIVSYEASHDYPIPATLSDPDRKQRLHYEPMAFTEELRDVFLKMLGEEGLEYFPVYEHFIVATALRLTRSLSY